MLTSTPDGEVQAEKPKTGGMVLTRLTGCAGSLDRHGHSAGQVEADAPPRRR
jgi:hypothetical protein